MTESHANKPASASGYLEAMARIIMQTGGSRRAVEARWEGIRAAFAGFDVGTVAAFAAADVDRLMGDPRMVRDRRKIQAVIDNAGKIARLEASYGSFAGYLLAQGSYEKTVAALTRDFSFMSDSTAYFFLAMVGETAPDPD